MTKRETWPEAIHPETDDARSTDSPAADRHRDDLAKAAVRGLQRAVKETGLASGNHTPTPKERQQHGKGKKPSKAEIENDARGQSETNNAGGSNNGVSSAKTRVITHSDDAAVNKKTPGKDENAKDWDINYDERELNEGEFRG